MKETAPFVFYLVLRADRRWEPIDPRSVLGVHSALHEQVTQAQLSPFVGNSYLYSEAETAAVFVPQKGRSLSMLATGPLNQSQQDWVLSCVLRPGEPTKRPQLPGYVYINQQAPFSSHLFLTGGSSLFFCGLYSNHHDVLVVTNIDNFDDLLSRSTAGTAYWLHRFKTRAPVNVAINTYRVCKRWARWSDTLNSAQSFTALEGLLFQT